MKRREQHTRNAPFNGGGRERWGKEQGRDVAQLCEMWNLCTCSLQEYDNEGWVSLACQFVFGY